MFRNEHRGLLYLLFKSGIEHHFEKHGNNC